MRKSCHWHIILSMYPVIIGPLATLTDSESLASQAVIRTTAHSCETGRGLCCQSSSHRRGGGEHWEGKTGYKVNPGQGFWLGSCVLISSKNVTPKQQKLLIYKLKVPLNAMRYYSYSLNLHLQLLSASVLYLKLSKRYYGNYVSALH